MEPQEIILRPKKSKLILLALVSLMFVIGGIIIQDGSVKGLLITIFFSLCLLVFIIQMIPGSSQLKLTREGFVMTSLFRSHFTKWEDVESFKEGTIGSKQMVMYDYVDSHPKIPGSIARQISGSHAALPDTYGLNTSELIQLLNEWKNKK